MGLRLDEGGGGSVWQKCSKHDSLSKHRLVCRGDGVCPFCLLERLSSLCTECARDLPCSCLPRVAERDVPFAAIGSVGRVANLIECEPAFRRSKSMAVPFLPPEPVSDVKPGRGRSLWRLFGGFRGETETKAGMNKSRSVAVSEDVGEARVSSATATVTGKGSGWYFPSPIKVFRQSRVSKMMFQQRSPLYRG